MVAKLNFSVVVVGVVAAGGGVGVAAAVGGVLGVVGVAYVSLPKQAPSAEIDVEFPKGPHQPSARVCSQRPQGEGDCREKCHQQ